MLKTILTTASLIATAVAQAPQVTPAPAPTPAASATPMPSPSVSPTPVATPSASPSPAPSITPAPVPAPTPSPTPTPTPAPSPTPSPSASPSPTPLPTPLVLPSDAPPQILAVQLSSPVVRGGDTITCTVITSTNVAAVEIRLAGHSVRMPRADAGIWQIAHQVPRVPFWMRHAYTAQIVAINSAGVEASRDVTISIR